jgi:hypothetical protein
MLDGEPAIRATETVTFIRKHFLVADEDDVDVQLLGGLQSALDAGSGTMVSTHGIKGDLHARWCLHKQGVEIWLNTCGPCSSFTCAETFTS